MNSRILDTAPPTPAPNSCDDTTYVGGPGGCRVVASVPAAVHDSMSGSQTNAAV
ncbi:hypothetical protein Plhal304r1_c075g0162891 [Plasmopara halstedii]